MPDDPNPQSIRDFLATPSPAREGEAKGVFPLEGHYSLPPVRVPQLDRQQFSKPIGPAFDLTGRENAVGIAAQK